MVFRLAKTSFAIICYSCSFFLLVCKLCKSGLYIIPYIFEVSRYTIIVYIEKYLVMTHVESLFSTVCCLFNYICWSVNCVIWVSKSYKFFLTCSETEARFIFEGLLVIWFMKSSMPTFQYFCWLSPSGLQIAQVNFLVTFCRSVNSRSWVFDIGYVQKLKC